MIRLTYHIPIWILFLCLRMVLIILGWVMVPLAIMLDQTHVMMSRVHGPRFILEFTGIFWLWSNSEDGIMAAHEFKDWPNWFRILYWCAFRNPVNNLRFVPYLSCKINPRIIDGCGSRPGYPRMYDQTPPEPEWFYYWQGLYSNVWIQWKMFGSVWRFWIGWKIFPKDYLGIEKTDYRWHGAGFATQFKRLK